MEHDDDGSGSGGVSGRGSGGDGGAKATEVQCVQVQRRRWQAPVTTVAGAQVDAAASAYNLRGRDRITRSVVTPVVHIHVLHH